MGTSTVVRDIEEMSRVLEGPNAKINYLGFVPLEDPSTSLKLSLISTSLNF